MRLFGFEFFSKSREKGQITEKKNLKNNSDNDLESGRNNDKKSKPKWDLNFFGKLKENVVISQVLLQDGQEIKNVFVKDNIIDDRDVLDLEKKQWILPMHGFFSSELGKKRSNTCFVNDDSEAENSPKFSRLAALGAC